MSNDNNLERIAAVIKEAAHIYIIGDGGSAAMADHFACDLLKNCRVPAVSLCCNGALMTALANDYGFNQIFSRQLSALFQGGDVLIIFTTSGRSANLIDAARAVRGKGPVIAVSGCRGGMLPAAEPAIILVDLGAEDQQECEDMMSRFCHDVMRGLRCAI